MTLITQSGKIPTLSKVQVSMSKVLMMMMTLMKTLKKLKTSPWMFSRMTMMMFNMFLFL